MGHFAFPLGSVGSRGSLLGIEDTSFLVPRAPYFSGSVSEIPGHSPFLIYGGFSLLHSAAFYHTSLATAKRLDKCFWLSPGGKRWSQFSARLSAGLGECHVGGTQAVFTGLVSARLCGGSSWFCPPSLLAHHPLPLRPLPPASPHGGLLVSLL